MLLHTDAITCLVLSEVQYGNISILTELEFMMHVNIHLYFPTSFIFSLVDAITATQKVKLIQLVAYDGFANACTLRALQRHLACALRAAFGVLRPM